MLVTSFQIKKIENTNNKLQGVATIVLDDMIALHDIKILHGEGKIFLAMPSKQTKYGEFKDVVHPIKSEVRKALEKLLIGGYQKVEQEGYSKIYFIYNGLEKKNLTEQTLEDFFVDKENSFYISEDLDESL